MGRARYHFDWGLSRVFFLSGTLIVVQVYRTIFFRKSKRYHVLSFVVFPLGLPPLAFRELRANHQLSTIINLPLSRVPYFSPSLLTLGLSLWSGFFSISRDDEFLRFIFVTNLFRIISSDVLGPASLENQRHSLAQLPRRRKPPFPHLVAPFIISHNPARCSSLLPIT